VIRRWAPEGRLECPSGEYGYQLTKFNKQCDIAPGGHLLDVVQLYYWTSHLLIVHLTRIFEAGVAAGARTENAFLRNAGRARRRPGRQLFRVTALRISGFCRRFQPDSQNLNSPIRRNANDFWPVLC
jgi:hypothetical protein